MPSVIAQAGDTARRVVQKEAVALGRLNERVPPSPFVVRLLDIGELDFTRHGTTMLLPWLAIEYVHGGAEGATLHERVQRAVNETGTAFGAERALRVLRHMVEGLREIHEVGVIHRDIDPANVLCVRQHLCRRGHGVRRDRGRRGARMSRYWSRRWLKWGSAASDAK